MLPGTWVRDEQTRSLRRRIARGSQLERRPRFSGLPWLGEDSLARRREVLQREASIRETCGDGDDKPHVRLDKRVPRVFVAKSCAARQERFALMKCPRKPSRCQKRSCRTDYFRNLRGAGHATASWSMTTGGLLRRGDRGDERAHLRGGNLNVDDLQTDLGGQTRVARPPGWRHL